MEVLEINCFSCSVKVEHILKSFTFSKGDIGYILEKKLCNRKDS